jgi:PleD family two-component response regulator/glyoxylase-like metal-dependent hydrolase (beta-lactamase superfamily II)
MIKRLNKDVYLITKSSNDFYLNSFTYLIIDGDEAVLMEPGSLYDYKVIINELKEIIDLDKIKYIVISHPDPDLTSSLPLIEKELKNVSIVTEWRTKEIIQFYNLKSPFYLIKENNHLLELKSKRKFRFIPTPFLHYSGSFVMFDESSKILFSGDLFGGVQKQGMIFADENYLESMAIFHENYIPSSDYLRPIMKSLLSLDINAICPQHGLVIEKDLVEKALEYLYHLEFYNTPRNLYQTSSNQDSIDFNMHLIQVLIRMRQLYSDSDIQDVFTKTKIEVNLKPVEVHSSLKGYQLWNRFFDVIYSQKGHTWLNTLESLVSRITQTYHIQLPNIYNSRMTSLEKEKQSMQQQYDQLETSLKNISEKMSETEEKLMKCNITGLYKMHFLKSYLKQVFDNIKDMSFVVNFVIDQLIDINHKYSTKTGDETMAKLSYLVTNMLEDNEMLFRGSGSSFILIKQNASLNDVKSRIEYIRNNIARSDRFIEKISISSGFTRITSKDMVHINQQINDIIADVESKLDAAKKQGPGSIVYDKKQIPLMYKNKILLVDEEQININLISHYFKDYGFRLYHARNPIEALNILNKYDIDLVISEINLSKLDGFSLKKSMNDIPSLSNIPFVFLSHMKDERLIDRANRLNVSFFMQKPFFMNELIGLCQRLLKC